MRRRPDDPTSGKQSAEKEEPGSRRGGFLDRSSGAGRYSILCVLRQFPMCALIALLLVHGDKSIRLAALSDHSDL